MRAIDRVAAVLTTAALVLLLAGLTVIPLPRLVKFVVVAAVLIALITLGVLSLLELVSRLAEWLRSPRSSSQVRISSLMVLVAALGLAMGVFRSPLRPLALMVCLLALLGAGFTLCLGLLEQRVQRTSSYPRGTAVAVLSIASLLGIGLGLLYRLLSDV